MSVRGRSPLTSRLRGPLVRLGACRRLIAGGLAAGLVLAGCGGGGASTPHGPRAPGAKTTATTATLPGTGHPTVTIGDKNFTEQFLLGELYAKALAAQGFSVELNQNIGPTEVTLQALRTGLLDLYPEYLGTWDAAIAHVNRTFVHLSGALAAGSRFARRHGWRMLAPTAFDDVPAIVVTQVFAAAHHLRSDFDLARVAANIVFGGAPQFQTDPRGLPLLEESYRFDALSYLPVALGEQYDALNAGSAQAVEGGTTDGALATGGYRVLADPLHVTGFGQAVPVVSAKTLRLEGPAFAATIDKVSRLLTDPVMRQLNAAVDLYHQDPASVAEQFLEANGMAPAPSPR